MIRTVVRGVGQLLITLGLVVLLFAGFEVYGKGTQVSAAQGKLNNQLSDLWQGSGSPLPGGALARLYIPKLKDHWVVVQGVSLDDIKHAPGHYPNSAMPGKVGNFAVAGHREPSIFWNLQDVQPGDQVIVETRTRWLTYTVTRNILVKPTDVAQVAPVPGHPHAKPTSKQLTLTTCNPKWDNYQRMIVHAKLSRNTSKKGPAPAAVLTSGR